MHLRALRTIFRIFLQLLFNVGSLDNFVDECIDYAQRLMQSGVPTDLRVYSGAFHGSVGLVPHSPISIEWTKAENDALHPCTSILKK